MRKQSSLQDADVGKNVASRTELRGRRFFLAWNGSEEPSSCKNPYSYNKKTEGEIGTEFSACAEASEEGTDGELLAENSKHVLGTYST